MAEANEEMHNQNASTSSLLPLVQEAVAFDDFLIPDFSLGKSVDIRVKRTVCYIVAGIMLRGPAESPEILLVQESKASCRGKWYLPAGRMEPGETIHEALKREVEEESGLQCDPVDLLSVEVQGSGWYRFTFYCKSTGGRLKTEQDADAESLSAQWFPVSEVMSASMPLRGKDILCLVQQGAQYYARPSSNYTVGVHDQVSPGMFIRMLVVQRKPTGEMLLLLSKDTAGSGKCTLPLVEFALNGFVPAVISKFYRELLREGSGVLQIPSVCVGIQSLPGPVETPHDGLCVTVLAIVKPRMKPEASRPDRYCWETVDQEMHKYLTHMIEHGPKFLMF